MSIKFVCSCGKHLRARDDMAARRLLCPRCGAPLGVPSLQPTHAGTVANPMTPEERRRNARRRPPAPVAEDGICAATAVDAVRPPDTTLPSRGPVDLVSLRRKPPRYREPRWYHCLAYPCRAWPLVLGLGLAWAVWLACSVALAPVAHQAADPARPWVLAATWLLATLSLAGYTAGVLDCALVSAAAGEVLRVRWPGGDLLLIVKSLGRWLFAFLAGPVLLLGAGFAYWLHGGDLGPLDSLILAELGVLAVTYWALAVAAAAERERFLDANPLAVARLGYRLGARALVVPVAAAAVGAHGWLALAALATIHERGVAVVLLLPCGVSGLFLATFLFRLLGMWCHRSHQPAPEPPSPHAHPPR
jgi:hypothetical protein